MWIFLLGSMYAIVDRIAIKLASLGLMIIDHYFERKEEHYKKMLQEGLDKRLMN
jgi:hypothetical protein